MITFRWGAHDSSVNGGDAIFSGISPDTFYLVLESSYRGYAPNRILLDTADYP